MKLHTILETAAVGATSAASIAANPFVTNPIAKRRRKVPPTPVTSLKLSESNFATFDVRTAILFEYERSPTEPGSTLSADKNAKIVNDVNDRVSNAVKRSQVDDKAQTSTFGLQDADGKVVKVTVKRDQAQEFESRLNSMLADIENPKEIAEVLFNLKADYDIVDVEWNEPITEDDDAPDDSSDELALDAEDSEESDAVVDADGADIASSESPDLQASTVQLLQQVIDLLKSETEVRTATANVATAKAETELQDVEQQKQDKEISQQQEIADMEEFEEEEKEKKKNERLLARIAKFRSAKQQAGGVQ